MSTQLAVAEILDQATELRPRRIEVRLADGNVEVVEFPATYNRTDRVERELSALGGVVGVRYLDERGAILGELGHYMARVEEARARVDLHHVPIRAIEAYGGALADVMKQFSRVQVAHVKDAGQTTREEMRLARQTIQAQHDELVELRSENRRLRDEMFRLQADLLDAEESRIRAEITDPGSKAKEKGADALVQIATAAFGASFEDDDD